MSYNSPNIKRERYMQTQLHPVNEPEDKYQLSTTWCLEDYLLRSPAHAITGNATIQYRVHWGEIGTVKVEVSNPTYLDLYHACDRLIQMSGDSHHSFIESIKHIEGTLWELTTGS